MHPQKDQRKVDQVRASPLPRRYSSTHSGLRVHGKNWKKIEQLIETRNGSQIRSHAQKFFLKMQQSATGEFDEQAYTDELGDEGEEPTLISKTTS